MKTHRPRRAGYSLIELIAVIALLITLGSILVPTLRTTSRDTRTKAAADTIRARMADARSAAMQEGRAYRVALSEDGTRIRIAPDDLQFSEAAVTDEEGTAGPVILEETLPETVTAQPILDEGVQAVVDQAGWVRVATFRPDGTCREATVLIEVREPGVYALHVRVRGLTGATTVTPAPTGGTIP